MKLKFQDRHIPFWLITIAVVIGAVFAKLIEDGMFNDALLYTSVAKNLGNGIGTFWFPHFSNTWTRQGLTSFHEQPPLVFGILAQFFKVFGNSIYTERIYTALTTCSSIWLIHRIWRTIPHHNDVARRMSWLPVLIWITFPVVMWAHQNMMCENTMELFVLAAVYCCCSALYHNRQVGLRLILAGVFIFLAALSKGLPGFFPIAVVPFFWLFYRNFSFGKALVYSLLVIAVVLTILGVTLSFEAPRAALTFYYEKRLLVRVEQVPVVTDRFQVMKELALHLLVVSAAITIFFAWVKRSKFSILRFDIRTAGFFFVVGLCGSVPLMLTLVQRGFYMTPAMPFFAISLSLIVAPTIAAMIEKIKIKNTGYRLFSIASVVLVWAAVMLTAFNYGRVGRDRQKIRVSRELKSIEPAGITISISKDLSYDSALEAYLMRYSGISVTAKGRLHKMYLSENPRDSLGRSITSYPIDLGEYYFFTEDVR